MKVNVNALLGLLLCGLLMVIVVVVYRADGSSNEFRPGDFYHNLGGAATSSVSPFSSSSDGIAVSMRGGRVLGSSRPVVSAPVSYAHAISAPIASTQYPIGGTPSNSVASPVYTTSSATMKSFGGGNMQNGGSMSMSGGSVRTNQSPLAYNQSPIANSQLPIANSQSPISNSQSPISPDAEALMAAAAYTPMGYSMYGIGSMPALGGIYSGTVRGIGGRKNAAPGGVGWDHWLDGMDGTDDPFVYDEGGIRYYDEAALRAWFEANKDANFPGLTWDEFLEYFFGAGKYAFATPVGEPWMLLILALGYAGYVFIRRTRAREV